MVSVEGCGVAYGFRMIQRFWARRPLVGWRTRLLSLVWSLGAAVTLLAAVGHGPGMFMICLTAILFGSLAALKMLSAAAPR